MKKTMFSMLTLMAVAGGCASNDKKPASAGLDQGLAVTEVPALPPASIPQVPAIQPYGTQQPVETVAYTQPNPTIPALQGNVYTVKRGDTLYRIAREHYGDGKQWQKIASANPGISPQLLKVGQKLTLP